MTQEQLVDICRLMDINKDGLVDLNEFLESFRLAEKSLEDDDIEEIEATWHQQDRRPSRTAVDNEETGVQVEILKIDEVSKENNVKSVHVMGRRPSNLPRADDEIELIDSEPSARRKGLLESDM